jgi:hypothetical protein
MLSSKGHHEGISDIGLSMGRCSRVKQQLSALGIETNLQEAHRVMDSTILGIIPP